MKFKTALSFNFKNKINYLTFLLICGLLFNTYSNYSSNTLFNFIAEPTATISVSTNEVCENETATVTFSGSGGTAPYTFTYTENDVEKTIITTGTNIEISFDFKTSIPGDYVFVLTKVKDDSETPLVADLDDKVTIKVNEAPVASFTVTNDNSCSGETLRFNNTSKGDGLTYSWVFGDDETSTEKSLSHVFDNLLGCGTEDYNVKLTVTDKNGCISSTASQKVTVNKKPIFEIYDPTERNFSNCGNVSSSNPEFEITVELESATTTTCITSYSASWGDGITENNISFPVKHKYQELGVYGMVITASGVNGCSAVINKTVKNISNPSGSIVNPGSTQDICAPTNPVPFVISKWGGNSIDTRYEVDYGDGIKETLYQSDLINSVYYISADPDKSENYPLPHIYERSSCPNTYTASLNVVNACSNTESNLPGIRILEKPKLAFSLGGNLCFNNSILFINNSDYGFGTACQESGRFYWDFGDGSPVINTKELTSQNHKYTLPGIYTVKLSSTSFCLGLNEITKEICIEPEITPSFSVDTDAGCIPLNVNTTNLTDESVLCSDSKYEWSVSYSSDNCGTSANWDFTNGTDKNSEIPKFTFKTPGKYTLTQRITNGCGAETATKIIDVKKPPTINVIKIEDACGSLTINPIAIIENCTNDTNDITYNWTFSGGFPSSSNTLNPGNITFNTPGVHTVTLEVTNDCGVSNKATQSFEIFEIPIITNTDLIQEICSNQSTSEISFITSNASTVYSWSANASANVSGYTSNGNSKTITAQTLVNNSNTVGTVTYTVIPIIGTCEGDAVDFIITVNPAPIIRTQPTSSEICVNGAATQLEVAYENGTGSTTYQWFSNTSDINSGGNPITGETNATYNPLTDTVGTLYYYVEISFSTGGCTKITSNTAKVTVVPQLTIDAVAAPQTICIDGTANEFEVTFSGGTGNPSYQWFSNNSNANTGGTLINGATNSTYTPPPFSSAGNFYFYAVVYKSGNGCSEAASAVFEINLLAGPIIDVQPIALQEQCQNAIPSDLTVFVSGGTATAKNYQWFSNTTSSNTDGAPIIGATSATYTPVTSTVGTFYYYVEVSQAESGCSITSAVSKVIVKEAPAITKQPISSEICLAGTATLLEVEYKNGTGTPSYQWFSNSSDTTTGGNPISSGTNATYQPLSDSVGTAYYYVEISFSSGGCLKIVSNTVSVKVVAQLTVNPVAAAQVICEGGTVKEMEVTYAGGTGVASYQWFSNTSMSNFGGTKINGEATSKFTPVAFPTAGDFYYYAVVYKPGNGCSEAVSAVFEINVLADPIIDVQPIALQELCTNTTPTDLTVSVSGGTTNIKIYQWFSNASSVNTGGTPIIGATSATYTPVTSRVGTFYYYVEVSQAESGCSVLSTVSKVIIKEAPAITKQPTSSEVCLDGTATFLEVLYENGTGTPSYQWFSNSSNTATSGNPIASGTNATYQPLSDVVGITYYYVEISFSTGGCTKITSNTAKVTVVPQFTINAVSAPQTICEGGIANEMEVTYSGGTGVATYQWFSNTSNSNVGGTKINGKTTSKFKPVAFPSAGDFYYYALVYKSGNGCSEAASAVFEINVLADPIIDVQPTALQELCQNATPSDLTVSVSGGTVTAKNYQWFSNTTSSNVGGTPIIGVTSATYTPVTSTVGAFYYYVEVSQAESGCSVTSAVSEVIVKEAPAITEQPISSEICLDGTATLLEVEYENGTGIPSYQWFSNSSDTTTGGNPIASGTNATYQPLSDVIGITYYYVEISFSFGGCLKIVSNTTSVIVNEIPVIKDAEVTIYSEATFNFNPNSIAGNTIPSGTKYTWSAPIFNPAGSILGASAETNPQDKISQTLENTGTSQVKVIYTITPATAKCTGVTFILEVTVNPSIKSDTVVINNTCFESNDASIATNIIGGIPFETRNPYLISWSGPNGFSSTNANISNLDAGLYTLRIEDKEGYFISEEYTITQPNLLSIVSDVEKNISCFQGNDGAIEVTINGGTLPYIYNWSTFDGSGIVLNAENQNTLTAGTYTLEIVDKNNCTTFTDFILTEPEGLKIETVSKQDVLCFGAATGAIEISVSGGTKIETSPGVFDYTYNWSGPNGYNSTSRNISNLVAGTYLVAVSDKLGCITNGAIIINQSTEIEINFTKTNVTCYGDNNGSIDVTVIGGKAPYQISWRNLANGFSLSNLSGGTYVAKILDGNNCVKEISIVIVEPIFFIDPTVMPISCNGENDGSIDLNLTGGIAPFSISWSDGSSAGIQRNNLAAGTYTVVILDSDEYQCPIEKTFIFTNPPEIAVSTTVVDALDCDIVNSGSIDLETSGGTAPYTFKWSTNETTEDLKNIPPGDYSVEITDANGCIVTRQFNIFRQEPITISFEETTTTNCDLKTVSKQNKAKVTGGYLPYSYSWSDGIVSGSNGEIMKTSQNGSYILTITDAKGCEKSKSFVVDVPTIGSADFRYNAFALSTYDLLSIEDPIQFTNLSTGDFISLKWDFGDGSATTNEENPVHTYNSVGSFNVVLTVEFTQGCIEVFERTITITQGYSLMHPTAFTPNDDGYNETIRPSYRGFTNIRMTIYDTWGTTVYQEEGVNLKGWNGLINGKPAENGNYVMVVQGTTFYEKEIIKSSPVTLLK